MEMGAGPAGFCFSHDADDGSGEPLPVHIPQGRDAIEEALTHEMLMIVKDTHEILRTPGLPTQAAVCAQRIQDRTIELIEIIDFLPDDALDD